MGLAVVGFDDTRLAVWSSPQLSTIRRPLDAMGRMALRVILQMGAGEPLVSPHVQLSTSLRCQRLYGTTTLRLRPRGAVDDV
ncbi:MAG: substrate-binding domain-containing protein [Leifsonia sp.]